LRWRRIVYSARSAQDAVREGFVATSDHLDIDSILGMPISTLGLFDPPRLAPPKGMHLSWSSDLGKVRSLLDAGVGALRQTVKGTHVNEHCIEGS
jgi:hypothetical protein